VHERLPRGHAELHRPLARGEALLGPLLRPTPRALSESTTTSVRDFDHTDIKGFVLSAEENREGGLLSVSGDSARKARSMMTYREGVDHRELAQGACDPAR
jgi:hypothetical protein